MQKNLNIGLIFSFTLIVSQVVIAADDTPALYSNAQQLEEFESPKFALSWTDEKGEKRSVVLAGDLVSNPQQLKEEIEKCTGISEKEQILEKGPVIMAWAPEKLPVISSYIGVKVSRKPQLEIEV